MNHLPNLALGVDRNAGVGAEERQKVATQTAGSEMGQINPNQFTLYGICCETWWEGGTKKRKCYQC